MKKLLIALLLCCLSITRGGRKCLSCTGSESPAACSHAISCFQSEVCFLHHYITETDADLFDLGCSEPQACHQSIGTIFGRQLEGHHLKCTLCCNNTDVCNQNLKCDNNNQHSSSSPLARECSELTPAPTVSGVYTIYPYGVTEHPRSAYCLLESKGEVWTVFQRRYNGSVNFYRDWQSYKAGFGSPYGEYWLGNDAVHALTSTENHELKVELTDFDGHTKYAEYTTFTLSDERSGYRLLVSNFSGDAANCMSTSRWNGMKFSTYDHDNDLNGGSCAQAFKGAWWYESCHCANLNGQYLAGHHDSYADGVNWGDGHYSLKSTAMMLRKYTAHHA